MKKNYTGIILAIIGVACALIGYLVIWNQFGEKTDALNVENQALEEEVGHLRDLADHKEQYLADTKAMQQENEEIVNQFPAEVRYEDEIMYASNSEKNHMTNITAIAMPGSNVVEVAPPAAAEPAAEEGEETVEEDGEVVENTVTEAAPTAPSIMLYQTPVTINIATPYTTLKDVIAEIADDKVNKKSIDVVSMSFSEETGDLEGTVSYSMYSLTGTEKTYTSPSIPGVQIGTDDLFNTNARKAAIAAERARDAAAASAAAARAAAE